jgi:hypothetical protein
MNQALRTPTVPTTEDGSDSPNRQAAVNNHDGASVGGESANSSSTHNESGASANPSSRAPVLVQKESKMVTQSKALVILVLLIATALVATMTYRYTTSQEAKDFETRVSIQVTVCLQCVGADHPNYVWVAHFTLLFPHESSMTLPTKSFLCIRSMP